MVCGFLVFLGESLARGWPPSLTQHVRGCARTAVAAPLSELGPPVDPLGFAGWIGYVHELVRSRQQQIWIAPTDLGEFFHVPSVILVHLNVALRGEQVEGGELQVCQ